jgi:dTDP-D-glucose 4,6-dehydratase
LTSVHLSYKTRSEVPKREPESHIHAKIAVAVAAERYGYFYKFEKKTMPLMYFGQLTEFPVDVYLCSNKWRDKVFVQCDGTIHFKNQYLMNKTKVRDQVIGEFCKAKGIRYVVLLVEEINHYWTNDELAKRLGLTNKNHGNGV